MRVEQYRAAASMRLVALALSAACLDIAIAAPASDGDMAAQAIAPYVPHDLQSMDRAIERHREQLALAAGSDPDRIRPARVFFTTGQGLHEFARIEPDFGVEVIDVSLKAPQGDSGVVMSILNGMMDLLAVDGSLEQRLEAMVARHQQCFASWAQSMSPDEAEDYRELAATDFRVYSARVAGSALALTALAEQGNVRVVMLRAPDLPATLLSDFESMKERAPEERLMYQLPGFGMYCGD